MNLTEIIKKILPHYEQAILEMPKKGHYAYLSERFMEGGICWFHFKKFGTSIRGDVDDALWPETYINGNTPSYKSSYVYNLKQLQNRIDWMKKYLSEH